MIVTTIATLAFIGLISGGLISPAQATYSNMSTSRIYAGVNTQPVTVTFQTDINISVNDRVRVWFPDADPTPSYTSWCSGTVNGCPGVSLSGPTFSQTPAWGFGDPGTGYAFAQIQTLDAIPAGTAMTFTFDAGTLNFANAPSTVGLQIVDTGGLTRDSGTINYQLSVPASTVTFDPNGGVGTMPAQVASSAEALNLLTFNREGFGFTGWNTVFDGSGDPYTNEEIYAFTSDTTLYAQWRALPATPVAEIAIQVPIGGTIANAPVALDVDGLKDQTSYVVTVYSTPQIIDQGIIWSGRLNKSVTLPSNLEAGWHRLIIDGTASDGSPFSETLFFKVSESGTLLDTASTAPADGTVELAKTGSRQSALIPISISAVAFGALMFISMRRPRIDTHVS